MTLFKHIASVSFLTIAGLSFSLAEGAPPEIPGNPGVPGLKAEIESLKRQLAATESELAATEDELAATEGELAVCEDELVETEGELAVCEDELVETEDELAGESKRYRVPQTGQNQCWGGTSKDPDDPHSTVSCDLTTGQDGETRAGLAAPLERFADNGDGTVTDNFTGLVWLEIADCFAFNPPPWEIALDIAKLLPGGFLGSSICGLVDGSSQGDWRVPNVNELLSLVDFGSTDLPDDHPFTGDISKYYWTSTTFALPPDTPMNLVFPCKLASNGYGQDNLNRFNEAYVVSFRTGETLHVPKENEDDISRKHNQAENVCTINGFKDGAPTLAVQPGFIAVRDARDGE
jgi:hypothetical protein